MPDIDALEEVCVQAAEVLGTPTSFADCARRHEGQHADAARRLGAMNCLFGINFYLPDANQSGEVGFRPFHLVERLWTNKLGFAVTHGYPATPSQGDIRTVKQLGYEGINDIGRRVLEYNRAGGYEGEPMPVPLGTTFV